MILPWKKTKEEIAYDGYRKVARKYFLMPDGKERYFEILLTKASVNVFAITPEKNIILVRQFRPGTEEIYDEFPGGFVEEGEEMLTAIKRELLEETGYTGDFEFVGRSVEQSYASTIRYTFVAKNCRKISEQNLEDREFAEVVVKPLPSFLEQLRAGQLTDVAGAYLALDYLKLL